MSEWTKNTHSGARRRNLGHGLELAVWYEAVERLPYNAPHYNVNVFGRQLVTRSDTIEDGQRRAEAVARRWLHEALLKLSMGE